MEDYSKRDFDKNDIINSSIEWINREEWMELKETNDRIKGIINKEQRINHINDSLFNELYLGGDWISSDSPLDF